MINKTKSNIVITSAVTLAALTGAVGLGFSAYAQDDTGAADNTFFGPGMNRWENLTDEEKAEMEARRAEWENLTTEERAALAEERQADREARREAMENALESGDYNTWVAAVKENVGEDAPILEKITADNFAEFVEAGGYMQRGREMMDELGVKGQEFGMGRGGQGMRPGGGECPFNNADDSAE